MWKAFDELEAVGWIGSQAAAHGCGPGGGLRADGPRVREWQGVRRTLGRCCDGRDGDSRPKAVGDFLILRAVRESGGAAIAVSEDSILQAVDDCARDDGFLLCPEGGAVLAGWRKALRQGIVERNERVLLFNCANGNKYPLADRSKRLKLEEARPEAL